MACHHKIYCFCLTLLACVFTCWSQECSVTENRPSGINIKADDDMLKGWIDLTNGFVDKIRPKEIPFEWINKTIRTTRSTNRLDFSEFINEILKLEAAFVACLILGLLYVLVMISAWTCVLCCRSCGNCGGNKIQRQTKTISSRRRIYIVFTICVLGFLMTKTKFLRWTIHFGTDKGATKLLTIASRAANSCAFMANWQIKWVILNGDDTVRQAINEVEVFVNDTQTQFYELSEDCFGERVEKLKKKISDKGIKANLGDQMKSSVHELFKEIKADVKKANEDILPVRKLNEDVTDVVTNERQVGELHEKIKNLKGFCEKQTSPSDACVEIKNFNPDEFKKIEKNSFDRIDEHVKLYLRSLAGIDLSEHLDGVINDIPNKIAKETKGIRQDIYSKISAFDIQDSIIKEIDKYVADFHVEARKWNKQVDETFKDLKEYDSHIYWGVFGLILLVAIPTFLLLIGLSCGVCGHRNGHYPSERSFMSNFGGCTLMASVYLMFIFSSIAMLFTVVLFQGGGHLQAYGCSFLYENDLSTFDRLLEMVKNTSSSLPNEFEEFTLSDVVSKCKNGSTLYEVLPFLKRHLDIDKLQAEAAHLQETIDYEKIDDAAVKAGTKLVESLEQDLNNLMELTLNIDQFGNLFALSSKPIIEHQNVHQTLNKLKTSENSGEAYLQNIIAILDNVVAAEKKRSIIKGVLGRLDKFEQELKEITGTVSDKLNGTRGQVDTTTQKLAKKYAEDIKSILKPEDLVDTIVQQITTEVGKCQNLYKVFELGRHFVCKQILGPVNALWFSLGTCCFFFLFAIPFATKLSKHFYRMDEDENTYLEMDTLRAPKTMIMPSGGNKVYPRGPVDNPYEREIRRGPAERHYDQGISREYVHNSNMTMMPRNGVDNYGHVIQAYPQRQQPVPHHQNYAYEPDIDSRWQKY